MWKFRWNTHAQVQKMLIFFYQGLVRAFFQASRCPMVGCLGYILWGIVWTILGRWIWNRGGWGDWANCLWMGCPWFRRFWIFVRFRIRCLKIGVSWCRVQRRCSLPPRYLLQKCIFVDQEGSLEPYTIKSRLNELEFLLESWEVWPTQNQRS